MRSETGPAPLWKYPIKTAFYLPELAGKAIGIDAGVIAGREGGSLPMILRRGIMEFISPLGSRAKLDEKYHNHDFFTTSSLRRPVGKTGNSYNSKDSYYGGLSVLDNTFNASLLIEGVALHDPHLALSLLILKGMTNVVSHIFTDAHNGFKRIGINGDRFLDNHEGIFDKIGNHIDK